MSTHQVLEHVDQYLQIGREYDCSDVHLATGYPPAWRRFGALSPIWEDHDSLTPEQTEKLTRSFLSESEWARLEQRGDIDFAYASPSGRYRASVIKQRLGYDMVFRIINSNIRSLEDLGLPQVPDEVKQERWERFMEAQQEISAEIFQGKVGREIDVLVDEIDEENEEAIARSPWDAPEIDGNLFIDEGFEGLQTGAIVKVRVDEAGEYDLWGRISA